MKTKRPKRYFLLQKCPLAVEYYSTTAQLRQSEFMRGLIRNGMIVIPKQVKK